MSAQVRPGYKLTEVGVIPEDWECLQISEIFQFKQGIQCPVEKQTESETPKNKRFIRIVDVTDGSQAPRFIDDPGSNHHIYKDDIFMVRYGSPGLICHGYEGVIANNLFRLIPKASMSKDFYFHYFGSIEDKIKDISGSSTMPAISFKTLGLLSVVLPSLLDQEVIAAALSDMDALISGLDQLIAKKRDIKQAAMQQLLTGQQRLPGFSGEWEVKRFAELATPRKDRVDPRKTGEESFCIELEHIGQGTGRLLGNTTTSAQSSLKSTFKPGDVLFGKLRAYLRKFWLADCQGACSTEIWPLVANRNLTTPGFLIQLVRDDCFIEAASTAYGTHMPRSDWNVIKNYEVRVPCIAEQTAIATILSDMDSELTALQARSDNASQLKQGMMQELLTGRVRLV